MLPSPWRILLFGGLQAVQEDRVVTRFRSQRTAELLARLAHGLSRPIAREELAELLWPDTDPEASRTSLRTALSSLRRQLEPPGAGAGCVLIADRSHVRLNPDAVSTDVADFEALLRQTQRAPAGEEAALLREAIDLYRGPFLAGFYEDWILAERNRLEDRYVTGLRRLTSLLERTGDLDAALDYAHRAVAVSPSLEEAHCDLMRLYLAAHRPTDAARQYETLTRVLREELASEPGDAARALNASIGRISHDAPGAAATQREPLGAPGGGRRTVGAAAHPIAEPVRHAKPAREPSRRQTAAPRRRLPLPLTRFFGRDAEAAQIEALLARPHPLVAAPARLVTITGPGGAGKTRLAVEVGSRLAPLFEDTCFVPLADLAEPRLVPQAVMEALGLEPAPGPRAEDPASAVSHALSGRNTLLVLDNFEHLVEAAPFVRELLGRTETLSCLVTSRQLLEVEGEQQFPLGPLPIPDAESQDESLTELLAFPSVRLFVDRAQQALPDFQLTARNAASVSDLCRRLEGVPLAIELAAAWAQVLTPGQMLERLAERFDVLVSRRRDLPARHRSLRAAAEWSVGLLPPELRTLFARLSVFRGGWSLEAVETVCPDLPALDGMAQLQLRSLISNEAAEGIEGRGRFRMLESLREIAAEHLDVNARTAMEARHAAFFLAMAEDHGSPYTSASVDTGRTSAWLDRVEADRDNVRSALEYYTRVDPAVGLRLAGALGLFWKIRGYGAEGRDWLDRLLADQAAHVAQPPNLARARTAAGLLALDRGDYRQVEAQFEEALTIFRDIDDVRGIAAVLTAYYNVPTFRREFGKARAMLEESLARCRAAGYVYGIGESLRCLANVARDSGDDTRAETLFEQSLVIARQQGDKLFLATLLSDYGYLLAFTGQKGDLERAVCLYEESLTLCREMKDRFGVAHRLWLLGQAAADRGDLDRAIALYEESLTAHRELGSRQDVVWVLGNLVLVFRERGEFARAEPHCVERLALAREIDDPGAVVQTLGWLADYAHLRGRLPEARGMYGERLAYARHSSGGTFLLSALADIAAFDLVEGSVERARSYLREALELAEHPECRRRAHCAIAVAALAAVVCGRPEDAASLAAAAVARRGAIHATVWLPAAARFDARISEVRAQLGEARYTELAAVGAQLPIDDALAIGRDIAGRV